MEELKPEHIILRFTELHCPKLDSNKQNYLNEILFKPSFERYVLLEWCLEKIGLTVELKEHISFLDSKVKSLLDLFSSLGLCSKNDADLIEGTAPLSKQIQFWEVISRYLLENKAVSETENIYSDSSDSNECLDCNKSEHEQSCDYINNVCSLVHFNTLYEKKLQLFPKFLQKEISQNLLEEKSPSVKEDVKKFISGKICKEKKFTATDFRIGDKSFEIKESKDEIIPNEDNLVEIEDDISESLNRLCAFPFNDVYGDLKPYLPDVPSNQFVDTIGPVFKITADKLQSVLQLKSSSSSLISADSDVQALSSDISNNNLTSENLSNTELEEYISIVSKIDRENMPN